MRTNIHKDFHGALSAGFKFLSDKYGKDVLEEYLIQIAENIYGGLIKKIKNNGLLEIEKLWNRIFEEEKGEFKIKRKGDKEIILEVKKCPAIHHMKEKNYPIYYDFCVQCKVINTVIAQKAGYIFQINYDVGKGKCKQVIKSKFLRNRDKEK